MKSETNQAVWMKITPAMAKKWLSASGPQRKLQEAYVKSLVRMYRGGLWRPTPDPIIIDVNGHPIDGQHRLSMIVAIGESVWAWVILGAPTDLIGVLGTGVSRSAYDIRAMRTGKARGDATREVQLCRFMLVLDQRGLSLNDSSRTITAIEVDMLTSEYSEEILWASDIKPSQAPTPIRATLGWCYPTNRTGVQRFWDECIGNVGTLPHSPAGHMMRMIGKLPKEGHANRAELGRVALACVRNHLQGKPVYSRAAKQEDAHEFFLKLRGAEGLYRHAHVTRKQGRAA